ncbi:hypothetical protein BSY18_3940 (plasmid) [Blastomonas sp. RAC04]|nr:hypothetical protein BSY18_3940 [Blastomonas sp. RAC04]
MRKRCTVDEAWPPPTRGRISKPVPAMATPTSMTCCSVVNMAKPDWRKP